MLGADRPALSGPWFILHLPLSFKLLESIDASYLTLLKVKQGMGKPFKELCIRALPSKRFNASVKRNEEK